MADYISFMVKKCYTILVHIMDYTELFEQLGLREPESEIYLALIRNGSLTISGISKEAHLHRPAIYRAISRMTKLGFVSVEVRGKLKFYCPAPPEKLKSLIESMNRRLDMHLPALAAIYKKSEGRPSVKFFQGREGIKLIYEDLVDTLEKNDVYYRYTTNEDLPKLESYLPRDYREIRDKKQLQRYVISNANFEKQSSPKLGREVKLIPAESDLFNYNINMIIYRDKIAIMDFNTESAVLIENKKIAEFQRQLFKFIYKKL